MSDSKHTPEEIQDAFDDMFASLEKRPWYEKLWSNLQLRFMLMSSRVKNVFFNMPANIEARNDIALHIKDDIEFGYTSEMIYGKIMNGSYGNSPISEKENWFKQEEK